MLLQTIPLFIICFILLIYYLYQDVRYREINVVPILVTCFLSVIYLYFFVFKNNSYLWMQYIAQIAFTIFFITIIFVFGKITKFAYIGEGDLFIVLLISFTSGYMLLFSQLVFLLGLFLMLLIPIYFFVTNVIKRNKPEYGFISNILLMFLGTKKKISKITEFYTPLENLEYRNKKLIRHPQLEPNCEPKHQLKLIKNIAKKQKIQEIWVSPLIPFIVSLFFSYVVISLLFFFDAFLRYGLSSFL